MKNFGYLIYLDLTDGILMLEFVFFKFITNSDMLENGSSVCLTGLNVTSIMLECK